MNAVSSAEMVTAARQMELELRLLSAAAYKQRVNADRWSSIAMDSGFQLDA